MIGTKEISKKFVSELRGDIRSEGFISLPTFNFEKYQEESRVPFGILKYFNEEFIAPNNSITFNVSSGESIIIIPLTGAADVAFKNQKSFVHIEQLWVNSSVKTQRITITNPYSKNWIHYLHIRLSTETSFAQLDFDYQTKDLLKTIYTGENIFLKTGLFEAKTEIEYHIPDNSSIFGFVINGAFECNNRLLRNKRCYLLTRIKNL